MAKEICISSTPHETRLAILEDDQLSEIYYERENEYTLAGSIYNGRVTRVLPGMQSAFVDIGLERDAFLYVTDFLELDDQEDADELEKAAVAGGNLPPREVRSKEQGSRSNQLPPPRRAAVQPAEPVDGVEEAEEAAPRAVAAEPGQESETASPKRWRGRRRRRGRGAAGQEQASQQDGAEDSQTDPAEAEFEVEELEKVSAPQPAFAAVSEEVKEAASEPLAAPAPRRQRDRGRNRAERAPAAVPAESGAVPAFVMPGESLSKYGGKPAETESAPERAKTQPPACQLSQFKPATLIEVPLEWDGSGLLPGESISRLRGRSPETVAELAAVPTAVNPQIVDVTEELVEEEMTEQKLSAPAAVVAEMDSAEELVEESMVPQGSAEPEADASASHHVDPAAPSGFRLLDLVKKLGSTKEEHAVAPEHADEELIEEEAFAVPTPPRAPKSQDRPERQDRRDRQDRQERKPARNLEVSEEEESFAPRYNADADEDEDGDESAQGADGSQRRNTRNNSSNRRNNRPSSTQNKNNRAPSRRSMQTTDLPAITDLLKPGQEILVQIAKEPIAKKGARITSHIALPGRFLVFMPTVSHVGVSRKIDSDEERHRLKRILIHERGEASGGFIVRTAAEGASEEELRADLRFLLHLWDEIKQRSEKSKSPALIYHDLSLIERILRDQVSSDFANIWVDTEANYERIVRFLNHFSPSLVRRVKLYTKETPLFEHFGVEDEISKALRSKVWLKSGGSIVINQTEALVAIDINTGKYVGKSARLEDTIVKTNLDAVPEIVRQIRLRDLGGIIVIDFIDMDERKNRFKVLSALEEALKVDRAPTKVLQFNDFGLVAITRKRVKQSLERTLSVPCPTCQATGMVKSPTTVCNEIWIEMRKMRKHFESADIMLRVHPETVKVLKAGNGRWLTEIEELVGRNVLVKTDAALHPEQFDIQG